MSGVITVHCVCPVKKVPPIAYNKPPLVPTESTPSYKLFKSKDIGISDVASEGPKVLAKVSASRLESPSISGVCAAKAID